MWGTGVAEGDVNSWRGLRGFSLCVDDHVAVDPPAKARLTARGCEQVLAEPEDLQTAYFFDAKHDSQFSDSNVHVNVDWAIKRAIVDDTAGAPAGDREAVRQHHSWQIQSLFAAGRLRLGKVPSAGTLHHWHAEGDRE